MKTLFETLVSPLTMADFLLHYRESRPFMVQHEQNELRELRDLPLVSSLEDLLNIWPAQIQAHLPDLRDEVSGIDIGAKDALKLFKNGMGLLFNDADKYSPVLADWVSELRRNLGLSALTMGRSLIYATPDGKGTAPHFDQNINFVLQISGTKKWTVATNRSVKNPLVRHTMGQPVDPEMSSYLVSELPSEMPTETTSFELRAGSLLFVPRGVWHSTEAQGDALSLNFTFTPPSWVDLFLSALRSRLILSPDWRETADGVSDPEKQPAAEERFEELLQELVQDLPHWRAKDILDATETD